MPGQVYDIVISGRLRVGTEDIVRSTVIPIKIAVPPKPAAKR
ncbi:MAG: hypothetical protein U0736_25960 [Gemmataceae bacterium]